MSIGLTKKNVAMYSTLPFAFFGARLMSLIMALCGRLGSSSPKTRPAIVSYCPAAPKDAPPNAGDTVVSMTSRVTRACVGGVQATNKAAAVTPNKADLRNIRGMSGNISGLLSLVRQQALGPG
jgi:hypothetical protein